MALQRMASMLPFRRASRTSSSEGAGAGVAARPQPPRVLHRGRFEVQGLLGEGCFGAVHRAVDTETGSPVAVKFESKDCEAPGCLALEAQLLTELARPTQPQGFVEVFHSDKVGCFTYMVMEVLSLSLEDAREMCAGKVFCIGTVALVALQLLVRAEYLHCRGIVHRDIKPENFLFGMDRKVHHLYMIDFGLSMPYFKQGRHVPQYTESSLVGTARYASINAHKMVSQSRRDDLESIGHMLVYLIKGRLPWSGLREPDPVVKQALIGEKKVSEPLPSLCSGCPEEVQQFLWYSRNLDYQERPDYDRVRQLFRRLRNSVGPIEDHDLQWLKEMKDFDTTDLERLDLCGPSFNQPDDVRPGTAPASSAGSSVLWRIIPRWLMHRPRATSAKASSSQAPAVLRPSASQATE